jgi:hypothetical protein
MKFACANVVKKTVEVYKNRTTANGRTDPASIPLLNLVSLFYEYCPMIILRWLIPASLTGWF